MHVEAFVSTIDQFEYPDLIELRRLQEEPRLQIPSKFVIRVKLLIAKKLNGSKQMEIGECQVCAI